MRPGIADATASGRVRLDAIARWLQDVAYLDLVDAGFEGQGAWVVRRLRIRVESPSGDLPTNRLLEPDQGFRATARHAPHHTDAQ
jgi:hypothetical protein